MEKIIERLVFFDRRKDTSIIFGAIILAIIANMRCSAYVINSPVFIYFPLIVVLLSFVFYFFRKLRIAREETENPKSIIRGKGIKTRTRKKRVKQKKRVRKIDFRMSNFDKSKLLSTWIVVISLLYYFSISAIFSLSSIFYSKDKRVEEFNCPIIDIHKYRRRNSLYYEFMGSKHSINLDNDTWEELEENDKYKNSKIILNVRKGLADSYVIVNWDLEAL